MQQRVNEDKEKTSSEASTDNSAGSQAAATRTQPPTVSQLPVAAPKRFIVFLFDDMHLSASDLMQIKKAATNMVAGSPTKADLAAVVSMSGVSSGLTHDRAKLEEAITKLQPQLKVKVDNSDLRLTPRRGYHAPKTAKM